MKSKTIALLMLSMSMAAFAAQKPCSEVFPKETNLKTALGLDGARCTESKFSNPKRGDAIVRAKVSKDNSMFLLTYEGAMNARFECEDVTVGKVFECKTEAILDGKKETGTEKLKAKDLIPIWLSVSPQDKRYLFGGLPPWEEDNW